MGLIVEKPGVLEQAIERPRIARKRLFPKPHQSRFLCGNLLRFSISLEFDTSRERPLYIRAQIARAIALAGRVPGGPGLESGVCRGFAVANAVVSGVSRLFCHDAPP